jgi:hypothetical protein
MPKGRDEWSERMNRFEVLDRLRVKTGPWASDLGAPYGFFFIPIGVGKTPLNVMSAPFDGEQEWEHVSVSLPTRCPTWEEMAYVKSLFWSPEDTVIQFHPPESQYVNNHPYCLHLWRNTKTEIPTPPTGLVGIK